MEKTEIETVSFESKLLNVAALVDKFEGYGNPHASRIATLSVKVAEKFNVSSHDLKSLYQSALVHDIGEMIMNRDYIQTNKILTDQERADMRRHPVIGEQEAAKRNLPRAVQLLVRWHHEWWNGNGYPDGLEAEQIPLAARILRIADTYSALTDSRPYRKPVSKTEARKVLTEWAGIEFDPKAVKVFLSLENITELDSFA